MMGEERGNEGAVGMRRVGMMGLPVILVFSLCGLISLRLCDVVYSRDVRVIDIDS